MLLGFFSIFKKQKRILWAVSKRLVAILDKTV